MDGWIGTVLRMSLSSLAPREISSLIEYRAWAALLHLISSGFFRGLTDMFMTPEDENDIKTFHL